MEQGGIAVEPMTNNIKQKDNKKWKIAIVAVSVVAACGIGFGVYGMMQSSQKDNQISDLKVQIKENEKTVMAAETPEIKNTTEVSGGPFIEDGYFYVPKWGAKFKLSDDLTNYGYAVDQNHQGDSYGEYVIGLTAISKSDYIEHPQASYYNDIFSCSVVTIRALEDSNKKGWWGDTATDVQFSGLDLVIHDIWRTDNCNNESWIAPTDTVAGQLKEILSNPEEI